MDGQQPRRTSLTRNYVYGNFDLIPTHPWLRHLLGHRIPRPSPPLTPLRIGVHNGAVRPRGWPGTLWTPVRFRGSGCVFLGGGSLYLWGAYLSKGAWLQRGHTALLAHKSGCTIGVYNRATDLALGRCGCMSSAPLAMAASRRRR